MKIREAREFFPECDAGESCLDLQPVGWGGKNCEPGNITAYHGNLVAVVKPRAFVTILVDFVRKILVRSDGKSHPREKLGYPGEQAHAGDAMFLSLGEQSLDKALAASTTLVRRINRDGSNFRQMRPIEMQRATADDSAAVFQDHEVADILANLSQASGQQSSVARIGSDESMDLLRIWKDGLTRSHGSPIAGTTAHALSTSVPPSSFEK